MSIYTGVGLAVLLGVILNAAYFLAIFRKAFLGECNNEVVADAMDLKSRELLIVFVLAVIVLLVGVYPQPVLAVIEQASQMWVSIISSELR